MSLNIDWAGIRYVFIENQLGLKPIAMYITDNPGLKAGVIRLC
jgi:hypothetical protein